MKYIRLLIPLVLLAMLVGSLCFASRVGSPRPQAISLSLAQHQAVPVIKSQRTLVLGATLKNAQAFFDENGSPQGSLMMFHGEVYVYHMMGRDGQEHIYNISFATPHSSGYCDQFRPDPSLSLPNEYGSFAQEFHADALAKIFPVSSWKIIAGISPLGDYTQQSSKAGCTLYIGDVQ